jgi:hypothetical protein
VLQLIALLTGLLALFAAPAMFWLCLVNGMQTIKNVYGFVWPAWNVRYSPTDSDGWIEVSGADAIAYGMASLVIGTALVLLSGAAAYTAAAQLGFEPSLAVIVLLGVTALTGPVFSTLVRRSQLSDDIKDGLIE